MSACFASLDCRLATPLIPDSGAIATSFTENTGKFFEPVRDVEGAGGYIPMSAEAVPASIHTFRLVSNNPNPMKNL
ncbi:hypothetical protein GCM10028773_51970 [Spirosoma koreense]